MDRTVAGRVHAVTDQLQPADPFDLGAAFATLRDPHARTYGPLVAHLAELLGTPLMPWQRYVADVALELHPDDPSRWRYTTVIVTVPRQAGKTTLLRSVALDRCLSRARTRVFMTAQTGKDAHARWKDTIEVVERSVFGPHVRVNRAAGAPTLTLPNLSQIRAFAPTPKSIHGETPPLVMVDEAWAFDSAQGEDLMGAIRPAQITLPDRQLWLVSTRGDADSTFLDGWIDAGRLATKDPGASVAFFEWSAPEGADPYDPDTWSFHPALGHTITLDDLRTEAAEASRGVWERAFLNRRTTSAETIIDLESWDQLRGDQTPPARLPVLAYSADANGATVQAAWTDAGGRVQLRTVATGPGVQWLVDELPELIATLQPEFVMADDGGHERGATEQLLRAGLDVRTVPGRDYGTMCSTLLRLSRSGLLTHDGHPDTRDAWAGASLKFVGDQEAFDRRRARTPQHPLIAAAVAVRAVTAGPETLERPDVRF